MVNYDQLMLDEIFLQLAKTATGINNLDKAIRVWKIFCMATCICSLSDELYMPMLNFIYFKLYLEVNIDLKFLIIFCLNRLINYKGRIYLNVIKQNYKEYESISTIKHLKEYLFEKLGISNNK